MGQFLAPSPKYNSKDFFIIIFFRKMLSELYEINIKVILKNVSNHDL